MDDISGWREQIDEIDAKLLVLLNERAKKVIEIGKFKIKNNLEVYDPEREKNIISRLLEINKGPLSEETVKRIFKLLIDESRKLEIN